MRPDRTNYEVWLIDYLDGNLKQEQVDMLLEFLAENPDLKDEFDGLSSVQLPEPVVSFMNKNSLRRSAGDLSESQFDILCAASLENDLTPEQQAELEEAIGGSEERRKAAALFSKTKLSAPDIRYPYKSRLRKPTTGQKIIRLAAIGLSAAATILILFTLLNNPQDLNNNTSVRIASSANTDTIGKNTRSTSEIKQTEEIVPDKKEEKKTSPEAGFFARIEETVTSEMKTFNENGLRPDSSLNAVAATNTSIEKIGGIREIPSGSKPLNVSLAAIDLPEVVPYYDDPENAVPNFFARLVREKILRSETPEKGNLKAYEVADAGITGLNKLFGSNMTLKRTTDENGEVRSVYFSSKLIKFNAPVKKVSLEP